MGELRAKRVQKSWQGMEQNQTDGRGFFAGVASNQPKPREAQLQTAQGGTGARMAAHAARPRVDESAAMTSPRIAPLLNWKVRSAEAWYRVRL